MLSLHFFSLFVVVESAKKGAVQQTDAQKNLQLTYAKIIQKNTSNGKISKQKLQT